MEKLVILIICGLCFLATPVYAQNNDIITAIQTVDSYMEAYRKSNKDGVLKVLTDELQTQYKQHWQEIPDLFAAFSLLFQKSHYEIIAVEKDLDDNLIDIEILLTMPDVDAIIATQMPTEPEFKSEEEEIRFYLKVMKDFFTANKDDFKTTEEKLDFELTKENGAWKISYDFF